ncbi:hypothetical protein GCM10010492_54180 [Saccharothrix mutabilis subsp. mutabilis]|uniref:Uncharacterized protein n=1 Tax=Saccharothrix mutabilis subsp. mutabilis TaxID=66855 RepID=A0ABN0UE61_9PSEU
MTAPDTARRRLAAAVVQAAEAVSDKLSEHPVRGTEPYPIGAVLPTLAEQHRALLAAVAAVDEPLAVDARGKQDPFTGDLAAFMSYLQLLVVLYHGLTEIPKPMQVNASRNISAVRLAAGKVRDRARPAAG